MKIKVIDIIKKTENLPDQTSREEARDKFLRQPKSIKKGREKEIAIDDDEVRNDEQDNLNKEIGFEENFQSKKKFSIVRYLIIIVALVILGASGYAAAKVLPKANVNIVTKKAVWNYNDLITVNPKIAEVNTANKEIPSAIFHQPQKNLTNSWPATGKQYVERKAVGMITVYNEFSSSPQNLVSGTRFEAPDGKIFKLKEKLTVPGAKVENGKIVASSIGAEVIADKAGEAYNIDPVSRFSIPGFKDSEKYGKFYGSSQNSMSGGFIGEAAYPTEDDIKKAKTDAKEKIKAAVEGYLSTQIISENFKPIEETRQFEITKEVINKETDSAGNFSVFIEAEASIQAFKESYVVDLLTKLAQQTISPEYNLKDYVIDYKGDIQNNSKTSLISIPVDFKGNFWRPVNGDEFRNNILSKSETNLKEYIFSLSSIEKADISLWPFWVSVVPSNLARVKVNVE